MRISWLVACATLLASSAAVSDPPQPQDPLEGALVSLRVTGGLMPYRTVTYEVLWRKRVAVANQFRSLINYGEVLTNMKLVPTDRFVGLLASLRELSAFDLKNAPPPAQTIGAQSFEVEIRHGGVRHVFAVTEPSAQADPRYGRVVETVRRFVLDAVGEVPFRNVFFDVGSYGFLNVTAVPVARLWVDGRDTGLETPIYTYELPKGPHTLELVAVEGNWRREHPIRVEGGTTTILHFDLR